MKRIIVWNAKSEKEREEAVRRMREYRDTKRLSKLFQCVAAREDDEYTRDVWELISRNS
jgi:hypothetical protein